MFSEQIKKTTAALFKNEKFTGSGVIFMENGKLYVLTAAHVLYGKEFDQDFVDTEWQIEDKYGVRHLVRAVNKDVGFSKTNDIALIEADFIGDLSPYHSLRFGLRPDDSHADFFFRGRYGRKEQPVNKGVVHFQENYQDEPFRFLGSIAKEQLLNSNFAAGNEWLAGCSGSGLFLASGSDIICSGILLEIPDKGDNGQLLFCSAEALTGLGLNVNFLPKEVYRHQLDRFSTDWFNEKLEVAIRDLDKRYVPAINFELPIAKIANGLSRNSLFKKELDKRLSQVYKKRSSCYSAFGDKLITDEQQRIDQLLDELRQHYFATEFSGFELIDFDRLAQYCSDIEATVSEALGKFYEARSEIKKEKPTPSYGTAPYHNVIHEMYALRNVAEEFRCYLGSKICQLANKPFLILKGEAGYGKSHLLGDICKKREEQGYETILLLGQHFTSTDAPWHQIIIRRLNLQLTEDQFLAELNIKAHLTEKRILLVVDAINEGNGKTLWPAPLKTFIKEVANYDGLGLLISVRTSYHDLLVEQSIYDEDLVIPLTHDGFAEHEYEASDYFFDNYGIRKPHIPFLHPEFRSPLFLKLFCDGLHAKGLKEVPAGYAGITAILDFFLDAVNEKLADQMAFDPAIKVLRTIVEAVAKEIISTGKTYVPRSRAALLVAGLEEARATNGQGILLSKLIEEGVFAQNLFNTDGGGNEEGVYFLYERFFDHIVANLRIRQLPDDPKRAFLPGGELFELFKDRRACSINIGLIEALCIQIPEKYGFDFFELVPHVKDESQIAVATIDSIIWRRSDSLQSNPGSPMLEYLKEVGLEHDLGQHFLETIFLISGVPDHPFNAAYIHRMMMKTPMPQRDAQFAYFFSSNFDYNPSVVSRLIDWSWKDIHRKELTDESVILSAMALGWFLISPDRNIRDGATKGIICLLQYREHLLIQLLEKFKGVDDPYVYERIFGTVYGCVLRASDQRCLPELCEYVFKTIFEPELVYPHVLVRDYAAGIISFGLHLKVPMSFDPERSRPPYRSQPITEFPTNEEIDKLYKLTDKDDTNYYYQNTILKSMVTEYGRGTARYGDFGRYTFGSALREWEVNDGQLSNYGVKRIFELGYDIELHGNYESAFSSGNGRERLGKKYQWIVLHEILARVSDQYPMIVHSGDKEDLRYEGAWQPGVRDIDPSMVIKQTKSQSEIPEQHTCWWLADQHKRFDLSNKDWMQLTTDIPDLSKQLIFIGGDGKEWVCLNIHISQSQEPDITEEKYLHPMKNYVMDIRAFITSQEEFEKVQAWAPNRVRYEDDIPQTTYLTQVYSREYYWSVAYTHNQQPYYGGNGDGAIYGRKGNRHIADIHDPTQYILWEKRNDHSITEGISFFKPSTTLKDGLKLSSMHNEGEMADRDGQLACLDPSVNSKGPSCLLVRKDLLLSYLEANGLRLFWLLTGEKRILSSNNTGDLHNPRSSHHIGGFYYVQNRELEGVYTSDIKHY